MSSTRPEDVVLAFSHVLKTGEVALRAVQLMPGACCVIGRGLECDVVINSSSMSRRHAEVRVERGAFVVEDLGSGGGTWAVARRERLRGPAPFASGDSFIVGAEEVRIVFVPRDEFQGHDVVRISPPKVLIVR